MTLYVVDASVGLKWFLEEEQSREALRLLTPGADLRVPEYFDIEVDSVLSKGVRRGELLVEEAEEIRDAMALFPIRRHSNTMLRDLAFVLACDSGRGLYDCLYLALAKLLGGRMVTADRKFFDAMHGGELGSYLLWVGDLEEKAAD